MFFDPLSALIRTSSHLSAFIHTYPRLSALIRTYPHLSALIRTYPHAQNLNYRPPTLSPQIYRRRDRHLPQSKYLTQLTRLKSALQTQTERALAQTKRAPTQTEEVPTQRRWARGGTSQSCGVGWWTWTQAGSQLFRHTDVNVS